DPLAHDESGHTDVAAPAFSHPFRLPSHQEGNVMLRRMLLNRARLILLIVLLPTARATAAPIFTHAAVPDRAMPWDRGVASSNPLADAPSVPSGGVPAGRHWVDVQSGSSGLQSRDPVTGVTGISPTIPSRSASGPLPARTAATPSTAGALHETQTAATPMLSSP